jgi:hypothetical protein
MPDMSLLPARRLFTVDEFQGMFEAGVLGEDDRVELIEGEILELEPLNPPHTGTVKPQPGVRGRFGAPAVSPP